MTDKNRVIFKDDRNSKAYGDSGKLKWKIMIVDDEKDIHEVTKMALKYFSFNNRGLEFISAYSAKEAELMIEENPDICIMFVDVVMEATDAGLRFIKHVRETLKNSIVRIILRTGQPGVAPETEVVQKYDINDYKHKADLTAQNMFTVVISSLRAYQTIKKLEDMRDNLAKIVEKSTVELVSANKDLQAQHKKLETVNTELHAKNTAIVETNMNLEKSYDDLKEAYKKISELEQIKTNFVSTVSHELRTPLTSVVGFARNTRKFYLNDILPHLSMDDKKTERRSKLIENNLSIIVSEGERLTRLINDVLDIAKIDAGKIEWDIREVDVIEVCRKALAAVSGYPKSENVEVCFEAPDYVRPVKCDPDRLVQVISNFLSNALKFTARGNVTLKVEARNEDVKVFVSDTGGGIDSAELGKVFEKFTQVGDTLSEKSKRGTGLGLQICQEIIKYLGGTIWAESEVGKGSRFCFTINYYSVEKGKPAEQF
ncbi:MAG: ATP-binding response regulator [Candidatus Anammoxibacter sp.]